MRNKSRKPPKNREPIVQVNVVKQYAGYSQTKQLTSDTTPSVDDTGKYCMEETISPIESEKELELPALPLGWSQLKCQLDTGQNVYAKTVAHKDYPFLSHPKMCKIDLLCQKIEFYAFSKNCLGPDVEDGFWNSWPSHLPSLITNFDQMIQCPGIKSEEFQPLNKKVLPTGEIDADGIWRSKK